MSKIFVAVNNEDASIDVHINHMKTQFTACRAGVIQAFAFAGLFSVLMNPILSKKRLEKLNKDMGKNDK